MLLDRAATRLATCLCPPGPLYVSTPPALLGSSASSSYRRKDPGKRPETIRGRSGLVAFLCRPLMRDGGICPLSRLWRRIRLLHLAPLNINEKREDAPQATVPATFRRLKEPPHDEFSAQLSAQRPNRRYELFAASVTGRLLQISGPRRNQDHISGPFGERNRVPGECQVLFPQQGRQARGLADSGWHVVVIRPVKGGTNATLDSCLHLRGPAGLI